MSQLTQLAARGRAFVTTVLSSLTTRGRSFVAAGIAAGVCAQLLGQRDLMRVAVLLVALPLGCAVVATRARFRLALHRTIDPQQLVAGATAKVRLELENLTRLSSRLMLAEDQVPYALGPAPRFVVARLPGGRRAAVSYQLRSDVRGRYTVGPLALRLTDPFGMCEVTRSFTATDDLVVIPRTWPLTSTPSNGLWAGAGDSLARNAASSGEDDITTREYRHGDDLRRVHWRSTARRGELMVRRDEQPRQRRATVVLDTRAGAHRGDGPGSSFEWAVSAAASVAVHLATRQYGVRLLLDERGESWTNPTDAAAPTRFLERLAVVEPGEGAALTGAASTVARDGGDGVLVAVLGELDDAATAALQRLPRRGSRALAILVATSGWANLPAGQVDALDRARDQAARRLREAGWSVVEARPNDTVTTVWSRVADGADPGRSTWTSGSVA